MAIGLTALLKQRVKTTLVGMLLATSLTANAIPVGTSTTASKPSTSAAAQDTLGRDTPRGTVQGFLQALSKDDDLLASQYLDVSNNRNPTLMLRELKAALDSGGHFNNELQISNDPQGDLDDKLAANLDKVGVIEGGSEHIDIAVERVSRADHNVWLISRQTLEQLPEVGENLKPTLVERYIPKTWLKKDIGGYNVGQMVAVAALLIATYFISLLLSWVLYGVYLLIYRLLHRRDADDKKTPPLDKRVIVPMAAVLTGIVIKQLMIVVGINLVVRNLVERFADILSWVALAWLLVRIIDIVFSRATSFAVISNHAERLSVLNLLRKVMKVLLLAVATIVILGNLGFDLTTGIAALGIGGLALALGAQKTIENLVGSLSLVADQPINVGDYCKFGSQEGTVEDIGIRSTRIRTSNRTVVTIPNGSFSSMSIENFARRDMFYFVQSFYISRDSDTQKVRTFITQALEYIQKLPDVTGTSTEVRISGTQQDAYIVEVRCYVKAKGLIDFNQKQTEMILTIAELMKTVGLANALPTQQITFEQAGVNIAKADSEPKAQGGYTI